MPSQYRRWIRPLLFRLEPERAHRFALHLLPLFPPLRSEDHPALASQVFGLSLANPIGLAAGFDKEGRFTAHLHKLGFGFLEVGTVTPGPQPGEPKPRLFRFPQEEALVNQMGFNNPGAEVVARRLSRHRARGDLPVPVGVNVGKQRETPPDEAAADYIASADRLLPVADYLVINVSSPNTPGLRTLEKADRLRALLGELRCAALKRAAVEEGPKPPLLAKLSPDMSREELEGSAAAVQESGLDGLIVTNTTVDLTSLGPHAPDRGGLSGKPLAGAALETLRIARSATAGRLPLIGAGGIFTARDVYERIRAGASLIQLYTSLIFEGPALVPTLLRELVHLLERDGFSNIAEAIAAEKR